MMSLALFHEYFLNLIIIFSKQKVRQSCDEWLKQEENMDKWLENSEKSLKTASQMRIWITNWVGEAHKRYIHIVIHGKMFPLGDI